MKLLAFIIVSLTTAVSAALIAKKYPGYVLVDVNGWTLETTLMLALVVVGLCFIALYYLIRFVGNLWRIPQDFQQWYRLRQANQAHQSLTRGLIALAEGKWQSAEKNLLKHAGSTQGSLLNYLAAARAAQEQGAYERRDRYLKDAHQQMPSADIAVGLTQAELQLNQNQREQALATLRRLAQLSPKHTQVQKTLALLYGDLGDWQHLIEMIPGLRKHKVFSPDEIQQMEIMAQQRLLSLTVKADEASLHEAWFHLPRHLQEQESVLIHYVQLLHDNQLLMDSQDNDLLEPLIRKALKKKWNESLMYYYGVLQGVDPKGQLNYAEAWLATHENNPTVLLTLGRLCLRNGLWGKARGYLEASIGAGKLPEACNELGNLLEQMGESGAAMQCYRAGLRNTPGCHHVVPIAITVAELEHKPTVTALVNKAGRA